MSTEYGSLLSFPNKTVKEASLPLPVDTEDTLDACRGLPAPSYNAVVTQGDAPQHSRMLLTMLERSYPATPQWEGKGYSDSLFTSYEKEHHFVGGVGEEGRRDMVEAKEEVRGSWIDNEAIEEEPRNAVWCLADHWWEVMRFFEEARLGEQTESNLAARLSDVERHLQAMFHLLRRERHRIRMEVEEEEERDVAKEREPRHEPVGGTNATEKSRCSRPPPLEDLCSFAPPRSTSAARRRRRCRPKGEPIGGAWVTMTDEVWVYLPPCYYHLFGTPSTSLTASLPSCTNDTGDAEKDATGRSFRGPSPHREPPGSREGTVNPMEEEESWAESSYGSSTMGEEEKDAAVYPPVGEEFILWICQWAKHDFPHGTRSMLLHFLAQLLHEADLPPLLAPYPSQSPSPVVETSTTSSSSSSSSSKAQNGFPSATAEDGRSITEEVEATGVPKPPIQGREGEQMAHSGGTNEERMYTRQWFSVLHISQLHFIPPLLDLIRQTSALLNPSVVSDPYRPPSVDIPSPASSARSSGTGDKERSAFVRFLCVLAEKIERIPELADFFITTAEGGSRMISPSSSVPSTPFAASADFVLLRALLPYLVHDSRCPEWGDRRDTCLLALSAVLSLARCPSPEVRDLVAREERVTSDTLKAARITFTTLSTVPDNDDSEIELLFLTDVVRYWSALLFAAPFVSLRLSLLSQIEQEFFVVAVLPQLKTPDERVYAAACVILAALIREVGTSCSLVLSHVVRRLLFGTDVVPPKESVTKDTPHSQSFPPSKTFFEMYLIPHLQLNISSISTLELATLEKQTKNYHPSSSSDPFCTAFRCCEATLLLVDAMATFFPALLMEGVLGISIGKAHPGRGGGATSSSGPSTPFRSVVSHMKGDTLTARFMTLDAYVPFILQSPSHQKRVARLHASRNHQKSVWSMSPWGGGSHHSPSRFSAQEAAGPAVCSSCEEDGSFTAPHVTGDAMESNKKEKHCRPSTVLAPSDMPSNKKVAGKTEVVEEEETPTDKLLALLLVVIRNEVLTKMLFIESNFPAELLRCHRRHWCSAFPSLDSEGGREEGDVDAAKRGGGSTPSSPKDPTRHMEEDWFHEGVHSSSLILSLLPLLSWVHLFPPSLCVLVCSTITTLCLLPDPRVLCTLLDKERGHVKNALRHACDQIEARIDEETKTIIDAKTSTKGADISDSSTTISPSHGSRNYTRIISSLFSRGSSKKKAEEERKSEVPRSIIPPLGFSPSTATGSAGSAFGMGYRLHSVTAYRHYYQPLYYVSECGLAESKRERSNEAADASHLEWKREKKKSNGSSIPLCNASRSSHKKKAGDTGVGEAASFRFSEESKTSSDFFASFLSKPPASISKQDLDALVQNASFFQCLSSLERFFYELEEGMQCVRLSVALLQLHD